MKTRFKILTVIACFAIFYVEMIPLWEACNATGDDCTVWRELINLTRPIIPSVWMGAELEWSGTADGVESPSLESLIMNNMSFVVSMIVLPFVIIGFVVIWDKRK